MINNQETQEIIKEGYKKTEVGVIPEDWYVTRIIDIADVETGSTPPTTDKSNYGTKYMFVSPYDLDEEPYIWDTEKKLSEKGFRISRKFPKHSILFTCIGSTIGKTGIATEDLTSNQQINAVLPSDQFNYKYVYYILTYYGMRISHLAGKQAVPIINKSEFQSTQIPLPPTLKEQKAIATALSDVDELIHSLDKMIEKKKAIKKGTMQQLLTGKRRLPGFSGEWEVRKLGDMSDIINGGTPSTNVPNYWNGDIYWCTPTDITSSNSKYLSNTYRKITSQGLKNSSANLLPKGTLLFCSRATIGELKITKVEITTNQGFKSIVCSEEVNNEFLYYLINLNKEKFIEMAFGSTFLEISKPNLASIEFNFPILEEQDAIASILSDKDSEIEKLQVKRSKYQQIKQGMMQQLLTGKVRLVDTSQLQEEIPAQN